MDLTKNFPRSPYEKVDGYMMLGRTIDKAHATLQGLLGEYMYDCPLDKRLFGFLGISAPQLLELVENSENDEDVVDSLKTIQVERNTEEIEQFNDQILESGPNDDESQVYFERLRQKHAPDRPDISSWFDIIEAEEGRLK
ncbi:DUF5069 domain-containing protein [Candidatus Poribacteria bacterium]|nr:DUF5069 domain-containing protein [Candidatus Poribacteria bacterium]MEC7869145.1 DUF5069 domain-containing protein [Candidatus Poribacteria bacterium]MEC8893047.1 DUF5069 domain-containing protein [Candidatus Poribacteria bacterium]MEC9257865.1 DUF5069 domain-containing protein [Candidatus Poribacteria bacterium]